MHLLAIDDTVLADVVIPERETLLTSESDRFAWSVRRREGIAAQTFAGSAPEPALYHVVIRCATVAAKDLVVSALTADPERERRFLARRLDQGRTVVVGYGAVTAIREIGDRGLSVDIDAGDSVWTSLAPTLTRKTFSSVRDLGMVLTVPGNAGVAPSFRLSPLAPRTVKSAAVGWSKRRRYVLTHNGDSPLYRYPWRIDLGNTTGLVSGGSALASGDDVRIWLDGIEQPRALVAWNSVLSFCWLILPALLPGDSLTVEVVYGNSAAGAPPLLAWPDLPAFDLAASSNSLWVYRTDDVAASLALGLWWLSKGSEGAMADTGVPGAWQPLATLENPDSPDRTVQTRATEYVAGTTMYRATLDAWRGPSESTIVDATNPYDGVGIYSPLGIVSVACGFDWINNGGYCTLVGIARDSASEGWARFYTNAGGTGTVASATRGPAAPTRYVAFAVWPDDFVQLPPTDGTSGPQPGHYGRAVINTDTTVAIDASQIAVSLGAVELEDWTPLNLGANLEGLWAGDAIQGVVTGTTLAQWSDQSGYAYHLVQDTGSERPTYLVNQLNGLPAVDFDGGNDRLALTGDQIQMGTRHRTIVALIRPDTTSAGIIVGTNDRNGLALARNGSGTVTLYRTDTPPQVLGTSLGTVPAGSWGIVAVVVTPTTVTFSINGTTEAPDSDTTAVTGTTRRLIVARSEVAGGVNNFDGRIAELGIAPNIALADVQRWEGYLAHKYALTAQLPAGHPYKSTRPGGVGSATEADIYEIATELRVGGGEDRTAPYHALLVGNARQGVGAGTPRAACLLSETVIIDGEQRTQEVWTADLAQRVEGVSAHAVRGVVGWQDGPLSSESPASVWLPLRPLRPTVPNGDFAADIGGWRIYDVGPNLTAVAGFDAAVGGAVPGSLQIAISANSASAVEEARVIGPKVFARSGLEAVTLGAWMQTESTGLMPRLFVLWLDDEGTTLTTSSTPIWTPAANEPVRRTHAARAPARATQYRIGVAATANAGAVGSVWFDDLVLNGNELLVRDAVVGTLGVVAEIRGRWL